MPYSRFKKFSLSILALSTALGLIGLWLWNRGTIPRFLENYVEKKLIAELIERVQPHLPFHIDLLDLDVHLKDLRAGKIQTLTLWISYGGYRLQMKGPMTIHFFGEVDANADYRPKALLIENGRSTPLDLEIQAFGSKSLNRLDEFVLSADAHSWNWKEKGLKIDAPHLDVTWKDSLLETSLRVQELNWKDTNVSASSNDRALRIEKLVLEGEAPLTLSPFSLGPKWSGKISSHHLEAISGSNYWDGSLDPFPISAHGASLTDQPITVTVGTNPHSQLHLQLSKLQSGSWKGSWKTPLLELKSLFQSLSQIQLPSFLKSWDFKSGQITSNGSAQWNSETGLQILGGQIEAFGVSAKSRTAPLLLQGANISIPLEIFKESGKFSVEIDRILWKHFQAKLGKTEVLLSRESSHLGILVKNGVPLQLEGTSLKLGETRVDIDSKQSSFLLKSSLELPSVPTEVLAKGFCIDTKKLPPSRIAFNFPVIEIDPDQIDPQGEARLELFGGAFRLTELLVSDYRSEVPETDFDLDWNGLRLDQLGQWSNFGKMDGRFVGYAHEVTFQSWLPTRYDFRAEVVPNSQKDVVFSPDAMKNVVRIFAGEDIEQVMPGIAKWLAFGWPSRFFGGYDIKYFGILLHSTNGTIEVETLDPPEIFAKERQRYILFGRRFRMPLHSKSYPLCVDATAMSNFVHQVFKQLGTIAAGKKNSSAAQPNGSPLSSSAPQEQNHEEVFTTDTCQPPSS